MVAVVGIAIGFGSGYFFRNYQVSKLRTNLNGPNLQRFNGARPADSAGGNQMMRGGVVGSILSIDDKSITVKLTDGSSKIVLFSDSTTYTNTVSSKQTDLKIGESVAVFGTPNSDGSVTAQSMQINPQFGRMMGSPQPSPTPQ